MSEYIKYQVFFTPLVSNNTYGSEIDVSDKIDARGIRNIRRTIDSGDFEIGVYTYDDINLKGFNTNGFFNDENDTRSIFPFGRDLAKVRIEFTKIDDEVGDKTVTISFRGLINEESTRINIQTDEISFRVLSEDSVIRNTKVPSGTITDGTTVETAIENILNQTRIKSVLTIDNSKINPDLGDITIDVGSEFDDLPSREALNQLLLVSNSVMIINSDSEVIVSSRGEDTVTSILNLFGPHDVHARENITSIKAFNTGKHRVFSQVTVNNIVKSDTALNIEFGTRDKKVSIDFITSDTTEATIAQRLLDEFKVAKTEFKVDVATDLVKANDLLDRVSLNYPLRLTPANADELPVYGIDKYGSAVYPNAFGSISIEPRVAFKIIEIVENPSTFVTTLKLRQIGTELNDGFFDIPTNPVYGFGKYGDAKYQAPAEDLVARFNPSVYGAGLYGSTKYE